MPVSAAAAQCPEPPVSDDRWQPLLPLAELDAGRMRAIRVGGNEVLVCRTPAGLYALANTCSHAAARMDEGRLKGTRLTCPLHGAAFDVCSGTALSGPATLALRTYPLRLVDGMVEVALPP
jgi:3-phenylpropionate/trans-cinnamate dioxygenase ferredoxin subunit